MLSFHLLSRVSIESFMGASIFYLQCGVPKYAVAAFEHVCDHDDIGSRLCCKVGQSSRSSVFPQMARRDML